MAKILLGTLYKQPFILTIILESRWYYLYMVDSVTQTYRDTYSDHVAADWCLYSKADGSSTTSWPLYHLDLFFCSGWYLL